MKEPRIKKHPYFSMMYVVVSIQSKASLTIMSHTAIGPMFISNAIYVSYIKSKFGQEFN